MTQPVIETVKLTKVFRDFWMREKVAAVKDLDLDIQPREVFGLLGPNGSGKSTTIKMILGLLFPTRGRISVLGRAPTDVRTKARIGFLPEESYLYPFLDARETLDFYGRLFQQPRPERRRRIDMLLEMVGLTSVAFRRVGEYSKGMQRRIGLAQALINDPDVLILDEPTSGMDPIGTRQFKDLIRTLAGRGKTILLSSHLLADVEDVCDRVAILYGGQRRAIGPVSQLLAKQQSMQLTTDALDPETLQKVRQVLAQSGKQVHQVAVPTDRLEELFLRIVRQAQEQRVQTGGALAGGEVAEFLRAAEPDVLAQLVRAEEVVSQPQNEAAPEPAAVPEPAAEVLQELVADAGQAAAPQFETADAGASGGLSVPPTVPATPAPQVDADRNVLDELLGPPQGSGS